MRFINLILVSFFYLSSAQAVINFSIDIISVDSDFPLTRRRYEDKLEALKKLRLRPEELKAILKRKIVDKAIRTFEYQLKSSPIGNVLKVKISTRRNINSIKINVDEEFIDPITIKNLLPFSEGDYYNVDFETISSARLKKHLEGAGIIGPEIDIIKEKEKESINLTLNIKFKDYQKIDRVNISYLDDIESSGIKNQLKALKGVIFNQKSVNVVLEKIKKRLFEQGHFKTEITQKTVRRDLLGAKVTLDFSVTVGKRFFFDFYGNRLFNRKELLNVIRDRVRKDIYFYTLEELKNSINQAYEKIGYYFNEVSYRKASGKGLRGENISIIYFTIKEGRKIRVKEIKFQGNQVLSQKNLLEFYDQHASTLASSGFLDKGFFDDFEKKLLEKYHSLGFLGVKIKHKLLPTEKKDEIGLFIKIKENQQTKLEQIEFLRPVPGPLKDKILAHLQNKKGQNLNIVALDKDLNQVEEFLREEGYLEAHLFNRDESGLLTYSEDLSNATLKIGLEVGRRSYFNNIHVSGNSESKAILIRRESPFKQGAILRHSWVEMFKAQLSSLGIFSKVNISPIIIAFDDEEGPKQTVDLLVEVIEKDTVVVELGPGYRTDLGLKLDLNLRFLNLGGMNRRFNLKANLNQRLNYRFLDPMRQAKGLKFLEYMIEGEFTEPFLVNWAVGLDLGASLSRKRYYNFDANIKGFSAALSKPFSKYFLTNLKYQYENINQINASERKDEGNFIIGSLIPSITFDFRDRKIMPRSGGSTVLSFEIASPYFGSMKKDNFKIDYWKAVSRNSFYFPFNYKWGLALSYALGMEKNLANRPVKIGGTTMTEGFIPSIKVFRLEGVDIVRGYDVTEINRLHPSGVDILNVPITKTAFFSVLKFEARHYIKDSFVLAPFFDAGHVFVNKFHPLKLRSSMGLSLKLLTPVGDLDVDLGVKLQRLRYPNDGEMDSFGRIHLLIGHF